MNPNGPAPGLPAWPWDDVPRALVEALSAPLLSQFEARRPVYLLVDPVGGEPEGIDAAGRRRHALKVVLGGSPEKTPYLIELEDRHDPLLDLSMACAIEERIRVCANHGEDAHRIGGWLQTHGSGGDALARQLCALFVVHPPSAGRHYLRLADRRVLALLHRMSQPDRPYAPLPSIDWSHALQGIAQWTYLDANFALRAVQGAPGASRPRPLRLEAAHWTMLHRSAGINQTLAMWQQQCYLLPHDAAMQADRKVHHAEQRGLTDPKDQAAYALEALCHPAFESWPELAACLGEAVQHAWPIAEVLAQQRSHWVDPLGSSPRSNPLTPRHDRSQLQDM